MSELTHGAWTPDGEVAPKPTEEGVIGALKTVFDPEIPVDIYELGLIYAIELADDGAVKVEMTLTTPSCPSGRRSFAPSAHARSVSRNYAASPCARP